MKKREIFRRLMQLREELERDYPLTEKDDALLWDVAKYLGLSKRRRLLVSGDIQKMKEAEK